MFAVEPVQQYRKRCLSTFMSTMVFNTFAFTLSTVSQLSVARLHFHNNSMTFSRHSLISKYLEFRVALFDVQGRAFEKVSFLRELGHGVLLQDTPSEQLLSGVGCSSSIYSIKYASLS